MSEHQSPPIIEFQKVSKAYNPGESVIKDLDLSIKKGEFIILLGESGCGKTTILKMINGIEPFDTGYLKIKGKYLSLWDIVCLRREIGYVIQNVGLFPHMKIWENISYVLALQGKTKEERKARAKELVSLVGLSDAYLDRYPRQLSGGQKQRIGVARALAADPDIILMDEPFGAVDEKTRSQLQDELLKIHKELNKTIIFVTHDIHEAIKLGSRIVLLNEGRIIQDGTKEDLVFRPANEFVRSLLGTKGFTAMLDEKEITAVYEKIINKEMEFDDLYNSNHN